METNPNAVFRILQISMLRATLQHRPNSFSSLTRSSRLGAQLRPISISYSTKRTVEELMGLSPGYFGMSQKRSKTSESVRDLHDAFDTEENWMNQSYFGLLQKGALGTIDDILQNVRLDEEDYQYAAYMSLGNGWYDQLRNAAELTTSDSINITMKFGAIREKGYESFLVHLIEECWKRSTDLHTFKLVTSMCNHRDVNRCKAFMRYMLDNDRIDMYYYYSQHLEKLYRGDVVQQNKVQPLYDLEGLRNAIKEVERENFKKVSLHTKKATESTE